MRTTLAPFSPDEVADLRRSFLRALPHADELTEAVYRHLFSTFPSARPLFVRPMEETHERMLVLLGRLLDAVGRPAEFEALCRAARRGHRTLGLGPEAYAAFGNALIGALDTVGDPALSPSEEAAWRKLYAALSRGMMDAR